MNWTLTCILSCALLVACGEENKEANQTALQKQADETIDRKKSELQKQLVELYKNKNQNSPSTQTVKIAELQKQISELSKNKNKGIITVSCDCRRYVYMALRQPRKSRRNRAF